MIIKNLLATEKSLRMIDRENVVTLIVDRRANKKQIKEEVEKLFNVKVVGVRVLSDKKGKKAFVRISRESSAMDIATEMGMV